MLGLCTPGARMNGEDVIAAIIHASQERLRFQLLDYFAKTVYLATQFLINSLSFARELEVSFNILSTTGQIALAGQCSLDALAFAHHLLGLLLVRPEVRIARLLFYLGEL